ncbi:hypothetical protein B7494_g358 [Chlorociboria aeruginascens]|nr:hypothetical protein B7494_g358 [Chlorociboria aeruginascens]
MGFSKYSVFVLLTLRMAGVFAAPEADVVDELTPSPELSVSISTSFPQSEIFGVKLINNHATTALLDVANNEDSPITVAIVGGVLSTLQPLPPGTHPSASVVRNLTSTRYDVIVPAGEKQQLNYAFTTDLMPQDLKLGLIAVVMSSEGAVYQVQAFDETVSVVDAATSLFDPQMYISPPRNPKNRALILFNRSIFLYLILLGAFTGTLYFVYKTWIEALFPQTRRGGKGGERARKSLGGSKKAVDVKDQVSVIGADGPAVTSLDRAQKAYDESWIPEHHINRPSAKRVKSGASVKGKGKVME